MFTFSAPVGAFWCGRVLKQAVFLRKRELLKNPVDLGRFHVMLGLAIFPDGFSDFLYSTHIHSFPFAVNGLRVAAALVRLKVENVSLDNAGIPLDFDFPALLAEQGGLIAVLR